MKFTGERYIPNMGDQERAVEHCQLAYEHWHRYLYASQFVASKTVLDIASGEGYGSYSLAQVAKQVVGVELDPEAVRHASSKYVRANLEFRCGSAEAIPLAGGQSFDAVVSFETIEHLTCLQQQSYLREIKRLLKPEGTLFISTPNKQFYNSDNIFHKNEFYYPDFIEFLEKFFKKVYVLGQKVYAASYLWQLAGPRQPISEHQIAGYEGCYWPIAGDRKDLLYMIAICSDVDLDAPGGSLLLDISGKGSEMEHEVSPATSSVNTVLRSEITQLRQALEEHIGGEAVRSELAELRRALEGRDREFGEQKEVAQSAIAELQSRLQCLVQEKEAGQNEVAELRRALEEHKSKEEHLTSMVELISGREQVIREMLLDAHDQLLRRDEEIQVTLASELQRSGPVVTGPIASSNASLPGKYLQYQLMIHRVREVVRDTLPKGATVLVASKGDDQLLNLEGSTGWHFPQGQRGEYAGHYPADSAEAIAHLESLRSRGADYLLLPSTASWWLDHYAEFRQHLEDHYAMVLNREDSCAIFSLREDHGGDRPQRRLPQRAGTVTQLPFGVNVAGNIASEKGTGEAVRSTIRSLRAADIPHVVNNLIDDYSDNNDQEFTDFQNENPYGLNHIQLNADSIPWFEEHRGREYLRDRYNVGHWVWELSDFPEECEPSFRHFDEIWVPSSFALDSISRAAPIPIVRIPYSIVAHPTAHPWGRSHFGLPEDKTVFLFMFDFMSFMERKNPLGLVEAFARAFPAGSNATLVLKCSHSREYPVDAAALAAAAERADVRIIDRVMPRREVNTLLALADCYVSLHRSEGFGLTLAEAMALGKPVIATAYSGNMDFMTPANSFFVKYRMAAIERDHGPYKKGCVWADPDLDDAAELMRFVAENPDRAQKVGRKARRDIIRRFHPRVVGGLIQKRLSKIAALGKIAPPRGLSTGRAIVPTTEKGPVPGATPSYGQLIARIRDAACRLLPSDAVVLVISKGDEELLKLGGRRAWHFPQREDGVYTGHYPADSAEAIAHLESQRAMGAGILLLPTTASWWLEHYKEFKQHLERHYRSICNDDSCVIYELSQPAPGRLQRILQRPPFREAEVG